MQRSLKTAFAMVGLLLGCSSDGGPAADSGPGGDDQCACPSGARVINWTAMTCFCAEFECPELSSLLKPVDSCAARPSFSSGGPYIRRGCGRVEYEQDSGGGGVRYQFDASSGAYLAATTWTDLGFGKCAESYAYSYTVGTFVELGDCADYFECLNCGTLVPAPDAIPSCPGG